MHQQCHIVVLNYTYIPWQHIPFYHEPMCSACHKFQPFHIFYIKVNHMDEIDH